MGSSQSMSAKPTASSSTNKSENLAQKPAAKLTADQALLSLSAEKGKFKDESSFESKNKAAEAGFKNVKAPDFNKEWFPCGKQEFQMKAIKLTSEQALLSLSADRATFDDESSFEAKNKAAEAGFKNVKAPNFNGHWFPNAVKEKQQKSLEAAAEKELSENEKIKKPWYDKQGAALGRQLECSSF